MTIAALAVDGFLALAPAKFSDWIDLLTLVFAVLVWLTVERYVAHKSKERKCAPALDVVLRSSAVCVSSKDKVRKWIVSISVEVTNDSDETWCLPVVSVALRNGPELGDSPPRISHAFHQLPEIAGLSAYLNLAARTKAVPEVGLSERERFVGWCVVSENDLRANGGVIVVQAVVFAVGHDLIGYGKWYQFRRNSRRKEWLDYLSEWMIASDGKADVYGMPFEKSSNGKWQINCRGIMCAGKKTADSKIECPPDCALKRLEKKLDGNGMWRCSRQEVVVLPGTGGDADAGRLSNG